MRLLCSTATSPHSAPPLVCDACVYICKACAARMKVFDLREFVCTYTKREKKERIWWSFLIKPSFCLKGFLFFFDCLGFYKISLYKISVSATCVIVSKKDANFSASERGIYTRDVIRSERYKHDRERRKRGRSGRHRGGTVHSFYFYC
mgnify:FL=1